MLSALRPATYLGKGKVEEIRRPRQNPRSRHRGDGLRALAGAAAQSGKGLERQGARPHRPDPRNLRTARPHPRRRAAGRARASDLSEEPAGALLDPSRAPARRLRLPRRPRRDAARSRPPHDRGAARQDRSRARQGQAHPRAAPREPPPRALSDRRAGRLHQCRQIDPVQSHDAGDACCPPTCCSRRSIRRCAPSICRTARASSCPTRSASFPICRPCWSRRSAPRSRR